MTAWRLDPRKPASAMAVLTLIVSLVAVALTVVWWRIESARPTAACLESWFFDGEGSAACAASIEPWVDRLGPEMLFLGLIRLVPILAGLLFGSLVGASLRSYEFAFAGGWRGWLTRRALPAAALLLVSLAALTFAGNLYQAARMPILDPLGSYDEYGVTGVSAIVRGLAAFAVTVLAWVVIRRRSIAIGVSLVLSWLVLWGTTEAFPYGAPIEWLDFEDAAYKWVDGDTGIDTGWRDSSGTVIPYLAVRDLAPDAGWLDWTQMHYWHVEAVLSGDRFLEVQAREALLLGIVTVAALGAAVGIMAKRKVPEG